MAHHSKDTFVREIVDPDAHPPDSRIQQFLSLPQKGAVMVTYVWQGGNGLDIRSKVRTIWKDEVRDVSEIPDWNYDGSSTNQAPGHDSEIWIKPRRIYKDPFRGYPNILVWCDQYKVNGSAIPINTRFDFIDKMEKVKDHEPWFGIEQEYSIFTLDGRPLGFPKEGYPKPQGPYYCGAGAENAFGRDVEIAHYKACLYAGVKIAGTNGEVMPGQWEYQVGPCEGIRMGDDLWVSRYILFRVSELFKIVVTFHPKPQKGDWNGAGCHTNYSTKAMREDGGIKAIIEAVEKLGRKHKEHIAVYGEGNDERLTGRHETASIDDFSYGVGNRGASIRIPTQAEKDGKGYFEDRRPASNIDPYLVTGKIVETTILWDGKE